MEAAAQSRNTNLEASTAIDQLVWTAVPSESVTVNTMPHQTVLAFEDHGKLAFTLEKDLEAARAYLMQLESLGINLDKICEEAQVEGIQAFQNSFDELMHSLKAKAD